MATLKELVELGKELGYEGIDLQKFVAEQQEKEREERHKERELQQQEKEKEREERHKERQLEIKRLELQERGRQSPLSSYITEATGGRAIPKLPIFDDSKDEIDSYLQRFERFAQNQKWETTEWATYLSALLSGPALEVYSRMGQEDAHDYERLKRQLLKRYDLTDDGYRAKFRSARPLQNESPRQLLVRLRDYFDKWLELSELPHDLEGARVLIVKEQFLRACPRELEVYLSEQSSAVTNNFDELAQIAERYMQAHRITFYQSREKPRLTINQESARKCFRCDSSTHLAAECPITQSKPAKRWCRYCKRNGHDLSECTRKPANRQNDAPRRQVAAVDERVESSESEQERDKEIIVLNGKKYLEVACCGHGGPASGRLETVKGLVNDNVVEVIRDTGCSTVVVRKSLLRPDQFTGKYWQVVLADNSISKLPEAKVTVDTPYYQGEVIAVAMENPIRDLLIGNIRGARPQDDPNPEWSHPTAAVTRSQSMKGQNPRTPLVTRSVGADAIIDLSKGQSQELQKSDPTIMRLWQNREKEQRGSHVTEFITKKGVLYRKLQRANYNFGEPINQLVLPRELREHVMRLAHDSIMAGHLGIKKTNDRIQREFFWPGMHRDITRYCRSCDVCQKTVKRGTIPTSPLGRMPLIDVPFKRCAVDLIGPISPPSEGGHQFILPQESTSFSPCELIYGRSIKDPMTVRKELWTDDQKDDGANYDESRDRNSTLDAMFISMNGVVVPVVSLVGVTKNRVNAVVLAFLIRRKRTPVYHILLAMAVADFLMMGVVLLYSVRFFVSSHPIELKQQVEHIDYTYYFFFHTWDTFANVCGMASNWCVVAVTAFRFVAVYFPRQAPMWCTRCCAPIVIAGVAVSSVAMNVPWVLINEMQPSTGRLVLRGDIEDKYKLTYGVALLVVFHIMPWLASTVLAALLLAGLWSPSATGVDGCGRRGGRPERASSAQEHQRCTEQHKLSLRLVSVAAWFIVSTAPKVGYHLLEFASPRGLTALESTQRFHTVASALVTMNYAANFFMYAFISQTYRTQLLAIACCQNATSGSATHVPVSTATSALPAQM